MRKKNATILDVARRAGVSHMTVSRVFSGKGPVGESTRRRILSAAKQLDYTPNVLASGLRGAKTQSVGIVWQFVDPWAGDTAVGLWVMQAFQRRGLATYQAQFRPEVELMEQALDDLLRRRIDALIFYSVPELIDEPTIRQRLAEVPATVVISYAAVQPFGGDQIIHDRNAAIEQVVAHLAAIGRTRPAMIMSMEVEANRDKYRAFLAACARHGIAEHRRSLIDMPMPPIPTLDQPFVSDAQRYELALQLAWPGGAAIDIDALFSFNDLGAMAACSFLQDRGVRVPEDVAVIGFNDEPAAAVWRPSLASGDRRRAQLADAAEQMVISRLDNPDLPPRTQTVAMQFVWRPSAGGVGPCQPGL